MSRDDVPFDLVVLADLTPGSPDAGRARRVDRDELDPLLESLAPSIEVGGARLVFRDFRDFRPEGLVTALPTVRGIAALRKRLNDRPAPTAAELLGALDAIEPRTPAVDAMRAALGSRDARTPVVAAPPASPPPAPRPATPQPGGDGDLDAIFRMVDAGGSSEEATAVAPAIAARRLDSLIAAIGVARGNPGTLTTAEIAKLSAALDDALAGELRATLHEPAFQELEAAWLGLRFLVRRTDFRSGIRMHVVTCDLQSLPAALRDTVAPLAETAQSEGRAVCAIAAFGFGPGDLGVLGEAASAAEAARVPLIADACPELLTGPTLLPLKTGEAVADLLAERGGAAWSELRERPETRWVALAANRMLARLPYGEHHERVRGFGFEEHPAGSEASYVWGAASWLVAHRIAERVTATGWAVDVAGPPHDDDSDLPVRPLVLPTGETVNIPLETLLSEPRALEMSQSGLTPLVCRRNHDAAWIAAAPALALARDRDEARRSTLSCALWLAQLTAMLSRLHGALDRDASRADRVAGLARGLEYLSFGEGGPRLQVTADDPGEGPVTLSIRPVRPPLAGLPETTIQVPV